MNSNFYFNSVFLKNVYIRPIYGGEGLSSLSPFWLQQERDNEITFTPGGVMAVWHRIVRMMFRTSSEVNSARQKKIVFKPPVQ